MSPEEKLGAALRVINQPELSPEEKLRLERQILSESASPSNENASSSNAPSAGSPPTRSGPTTCAPEASWTPDPEAMWIPPQDEQAFIRESCLRMLAILDQTMGDMAKMQEAIRESDPEEQLGSLALQQQMILYEAARTVAIQLHMMAAKPIPKLDLPTMGLVTPDGTQLRKERKPNA